MGRAWVPSIIQGAAIVVTVVLLPMTLPRLEATGAAITSSAAYGISAAAAAVCLLRLKTQRGSTREPDLATGLSGADPRVPGNLSS